MAAYCAVLNDNFDNDINQKKLKHQNASKMAGIIKPRTNLSSQPFETGYHRHLQRHTPIGNCVFILIVLSALNLLCLSFFLTKLTKEALVRLRHWYGKIMQ